MREDQRRRLMAPPLRAVHHLALCADDIKATIDFLCRCARYAARSCDEGPPGLGTGPGNRGNPPYSGSAITFSI
jgi:hypothetical protein